MKLSSKERDVLEKILSDQPISQVDRIIIIKVLEKDLQQSLTNKDYIELVLTLFSLYELFQQFIE